jgi:hypothetical protein
MERLIVETNSLLAITPWRNKLEKIEDQVCRIEIATSRGMQYGTGFLVGPGVVLTNFHVMEPAILPLLGRPAKRGVVAQPAKVVFRFDYKHFPDGLTVNQGVEHGLVAEDWLIDWSPYSIVDTHPSPSGQLPAPDELDYALIRLQSLPTHGEDRVTQSRGWVSLNDGQGEFKPGTPLFIVQHPDGSHQKLALDTQGIIDGNDNGTRVTYRTNTEPGSSGSPCFNQHWRLIALHQCGDPNYEEFHKPAYNQGIPTAAIRALLTQRGKIHELGD